MEISELATKSTPTVRAEWLRAAMLFGLVIAAGLATNPFFEMGFNDDWDYSRLALAFAKTGQIHYAGWTAVSALVQSVYGGTLSYLFGGGPTVHRLGTLFAAGFIPILTYLIGRELGLRARVAYFAALTFGLSPFMIPNAVSFMTDTYGCLFTLGAIHAGLKAVRAERESSAFAWLLAGLLWAFLGGAERQVVWVAGPSVMAGYLIAWRAGDRKYLVLASFASAAYLATCWLLMNWLKRQPGFIFEAPDASTVLMSRNQVLRAVQLYGALLLTLVALSLPALAAGVSLRAHRLILAASALCGAAAYMISGRVLSLRFPYLPNQLTIYGLLNPEAVLPGNVPVLLSPQLCRVVTALACALAVFLLASVLPRLRENAMGLRRTVFKANIAEHREAVAYVVPVTYALLYLGALLVRARRGEFYDRYALLLLPLAIFAVLRLWQAAGMERPGAAAYVLLGILATYGVAITHDYFALSKARAGAIDRLSASGVARNLVIAGFEADMAYQVESRGSIHHVAEVDSSVPEGMSPRIWYIAMTPAITPVYFFSTSKLAGMEPCGVAPIPYQTWLGPHGRSLYVLCHTG